MTANMATTNTDDVQRDHAARDWLLSSDEPTLRERTRRELLLDAGNDASDHDAAADPRRRLCSKDWGQTALPAVAGVGRSGGFSPFSISALTRRSPLPSRRQYVVDQALRRPQHRGHPTVINGLHRLCANVEGIALTVGSRAGLADRDDRLHRLADALIAWQWPDGGWNCHRNASGHRSSFHESLTTANGLHHYALATGDDRATHAATRTAELFLQHASCRSRSEVPRRPVRTAASPIAWGERRVLVAGSVRHGGVGPGGARR